MSRGSKCVFVGNIPYEATKEQLVEIFKTVGPVVSFRLVHDRDTGKMKGYGFCEFKDAETALSAMRNLNNHEFKGRHLRVDFAENDTKGSSSSRRSKEHAPIPSGPPSTVRTSVTRTPSGGMPAAPTPSASRSSTEAIASVLGGMTKHELYEIMVQLKTLIQSNPAKARETLAGNPQLSMALLQAQVLLGMIKPAQLQQVLAQHAATAPAPTPTVVPTPTTTFPAVPTPAVHPSIPYNPQPAMVLPTGLPAVSHPVASPAMTAEQQQLLVQQIMNLTPEQIQGLPPDQQLQIKALQEQVRLLQRTNK